MTAAIFQDTTQAVPDVGTYGSVLYNAGTASLRCDITSGTNEGVSTTVSGLIVGRQYCASLYIMTTAGFDDVVMSISNGSADLSSAEKIPYGGNLDTPGYGGGPYGGIGGATELPPQPWTRISAFFTATADSHTMTVLATVDPGALYPVSFWMDAVMVEEGEILQPYFDGSFGQNALWEDGGTAGLARSYYYDQYLQAQHIVTDALAADTPLGISYDTPTYADFALQGLTSAPGVISISALLSGHLTPSAGATDITAPGTKTATAHLTANMTRNSSGSLSGSGVITSGSQLIGQLAGTSTNVGPNALLASASYPLPTYTGTSLGPLQQVPLPTRGFWQIDGTDEITDIAAHVWGSTTQAYVSNNTSANKGGIVGGAGATIDGYPVPAGTVVFQFLDFSTNGNNGGNLYFTTGGPNILFRGCRFRAGSYAAPGVFNSETGGFASDLYIHYCDLGGSGPSLADCATVAIDVEQGANLRCLRNYISYVSTGMQPNMGTFCDVIENFIEKITLADPTWHLNGIAVNGGNPNFLILRNSIVTANTDELGNAITQTDCIAMFQDFGTFPGNGTNSDGSTGYYVQGNFVGGTGYCFYIGQNAGTAASTVNNVHFDNNLVTTASYSTGGSFGPANAIPTWGSFGNEETNNLWADGSLSGTSFI